MPFYLQAVVMFAGSKDLFLETPLEKVSLAEKKWLQFVEANYPKVIESIREDKEISDSTGEILEKAMKEFKEANADLFEDK